MKKLIWETLGLIERDLGEDRSSQLHRYFFERENSSKMQFSNIEVQRFDLHYYIESMRVTQYGTNKLQLAKFYHWAAICCGLLMCTILYQYQILHRYQTIGHPNYFWHILDSRRNIWFLYSQVGVCLKNVKYSGWDSGGKRVIPNFQHPNILSKPD